MRLELKDYVFVGIQIILFIIYFLDLQLLNFSIPSLVKVVVGILTILGILIILLSILQLNTNISPFPSPRSKTILITSGLFKYMRHPIYSGILISSISYAIYSGSIYKLIVAVVLYFLFYFKSIYEERKLSQQFSNYKNYMKVTGRFFPIIKSQN